MRNKLKKQQNGSGDAPAKKKKRQRLDIWNKLAIAVLTVVLVGCVSVFTLLVNVISEAPNFNPEQLVAGTSSRVYDKDGNIIAELGSEHRDNIKYEDIPQDLIDAFLAIEDSRFFQHNGFDLPRFLSSALNNLASGSLSQGGSTLTMQLVDNTWIANAKAQATQNGESLSAIDNIKYKIQEIYLSLLTEQSVGKKDILVNYLNMIWFGSDGGTRGVQNAALYYFGKDVNELNLSECAFLAGVINAPASYSPYYNYDLAMTRRNQTLQLMLQHGYISEEEYNLASSTNLAFQLEESESFTEDPYQSIVEMAVQETRELTGMDPYTTAMDIYTGIDSEAQQLAYDISNGEVYAFPDQYFNAGLTLINNSNGEIIAMGPGREYTGDSTSRNAATEPQQPGSAMKPILEYVNTFDILGWSTTHTVDDKADDYFHIGRDLQNSDGQYMGKMSLADAVSLSRNTTAAAALQDLIDSQGSSYFVQYLKDMGFNDDVADAFDIQYSIGGGNMRCSTVQLANAYSALANGGVRVDAHVIRSVEVRGGDTYEYNADETQVVSEGAAYMMSSILYKTVNGGYPMYTSTLATNAYSVFGKTGTTDWGDSGAQYGIPKTAMKDEWTVGYTSDYTVAVWTGYTSTGIENGYYITLQVLYQNFASQAADAMLDLVSANSTPADLVQPSSVVSKASRDGGLILSQYYNTEESRSEGQEDDPNSKQRQKRMELQKKCKDDPTIDEDCDGYEEAMEELQNRCSADPTIDERCDGYEEAMQQRQQQQACEASGGTWANGVCTPATTTVPDNPGSSQPDDDETTTAPSNG